MRFRYVDHITAWTANERICGVKSVSFEEVSLKEAWGGPLHMPESLLAESFLQLGNWLVLLSTDFERFGLVTRIAKVRLESEVGPGEQIDIELRVVRRRGEIWEMDGEGSVAGRPVMRGSGCLAAQVPARDFVDPEGLRALYAKLYRPVVPTAAPPPDALARFRASA